MAVQVNVYEAKTQLSKLLDRAQRGERVVIAKNGKPIADLVRHERGRIQFDALKDEISYDEDEFNAADAEIAAMFDPELELGNAAS